jgi:hypothetical protein
MSTHARPVARLVAVAVAGVAAFVAGCASDDDDGGAAPLASVGSTTSASTGSTSPPTTDVGTTPPALTDVATSAAVTTATTTATAGTEAGGYRQVEASALLDFDGSTHPIEDPLADGVFYARTYELTADGSAVQFDLARFTDADACIAALPTVPEGTIDDSGCFGGQVDASATAAVTLPLDRDVPVILVTSRYEYFEVTAQEFARLLGGAQPAPDAPTGFAYQPYWDALVEIAGGQVVRVNQRPSS